MGTNKTVNHKYTTIHAHTSTVYFYERIRKRKHHFQLVLSWPDCHGIPTKNRPVGSLSNWTRLFLQIIQHLKYSHNYTYLFWLNSWMTQMQVNRVPVETHIIMYSALDMQAHHNPAQPGYKQPARQRMVAFYISVTINSTYKHSFMSTIGL